MPDDMTSDSPAASSSPVIPMWATVHLTHAALQAVADDAGVDILHIKGPTDARFRARQHDSTDADIVVRPAHLDAFVAALRARGWTPYTGFEEGSPFGHAANFEHPTWTWVDVHRSIPGFTLDPTSVFDQLWAEHTTAHLANWPCAVPSPRGQVLIQVMHAARSHGSEQPETWAQCPVELRPSVRELARELGGDTAFAAGIGELDAHRNDAGYATWKYWSTPGDDRLSEWRARWAAARGMRAKLAVVHQGLRVNRTHLRLRLGHEPTRADVAREQLHRAGNAAASLGRMVSRRRTPPPGSDS